MKLKIITIFLLLSSLNAAEIRYAKGSFNWDFGIENFTESNFDLDISTLSLTESHDNFGSTNVYYFYNATLYSSDYVDQITTLMAYPVTYEFPLVGSINDAVDTYTPIPVPSEYKIRGFDLDLGIGYDLYKQNKNFFGIAINTGFSIPVMKMKNLQKSAEFAYDLLDATKTTIITYKLGPAVQGGYTILPSLLAYGTFGFGYQTGSIENDWIRSKMDVDGSYSTFDIGLKFSPLPHYPRLYISLGYSKKSWNMDKVKADMYDIFKVSSYGILKSSFSAKSLYLGAGYQF